MEVVWSKTGIRRLAPRRVGPSRPKKPGKVKGDKASAAIRSKLEEIGTVAAWRSGLKKCPDSIRARVEDSVERSLGSTPPWPENLDPTTQAILAAMLWVPPSPLYTFWCQREGPAFAVATTLKSWEYSLTHDYAGKSCYVVTVDPPSNERFAHSLSSLDALPSLRKFLASCPDQDYQEALQVAQEHWDGSPLARRCLICYLFPDQKQWADQCASELPGAQAGFAWVLLSCELSLDQARELVGMATTRSSHFKEYLSAFPFACSLLDIHGVAAYPLLVDLLGPAELLSDRRLVVEALGQLRGEPAARTCVDLLPEKGLRKQLVEALMAHPEHSRTALQESSHKEALEVLSLFPKR